MVVKEELCHREHLIGNEEHTCCVSVYVVLLKHKVSISTNHQCMDFFLQQPSFHPFLMKTWAVTISMLR